MRRITTLAVSLVTAAAMTLAAAGDLRAQRVEIPDFEFPAFISAFAEDREPLGIAIDHLNHVYVVDYQHDKVRKYTIGGAFLEEFGDLKFGAIDVAVGFEDRVYALHGANAVGDGTVTVYTSGGDFVTSWDMPSGQVRAIVADDDDVFVSFWEGDPPQSTIVRYTPDGLDPVAWQVTPADGSRVTAMDLGVPPAGDPNRLYLVDDHNHRFCIYQRDGTFETCLGTFGTGDGDDEFAYPRGILEIGAGIYVVDTENDRIKIFATATLELLWTWGSLGTGDGEFNTPTRIQTNEDKEIYVADTINGRIQRFETTHCPPPQLAGDFDYIAWGDAGDNTLEGTPGRDALYGLGGNDIIFGYDGDDLLCGGPNRIIGEEGRDGSDTIRGGRGDDVIAGLLGNDVLKGGPGNDIVQGGSGRDHVSGGPGNDNLDGGSGNDRGTILGVARGVFGNAGDDAPVGGGSGHDRVAGGPGNDIVTGNSGADRVLGGAGFDLLFGDLGNDRMHGGTGDDEMHGLPGVDRMWGDAGNDHLYGWSNRDWLWGGDGDDLLFGGDGGDRVFGGLGDDEAYGEAGRDLLRGDHQRVEDDARCATASCRDLLLGGDDDDRLFGGPDIDIVRGEDGDDDVFGGAGSDLVTGSYGDDVLYGQAGDDVLAGDAGANDEAFGGPGFDVCVAETPHSCERWAPSGDPFMLF